MPEEVDNLFQILKLKLYAQKAYISKIHTRNLGNTGKEIHLTLSQNCKPEVIMKALEYNKKWLISGNILKMNIQDLGSFWFKELIQNIEAMSQ
jgi:transcription-repair coupling factor (superfamily II helicase)